LAAAAGGDALTKAAEGFLDLHGGKMASLPTSLCRKPANQAIGVPGNRRINPEGVRPRADGGVTEFELRVGGRASMGLPIHPGEHLGEELAELKLSAAELARQIKVPTNRITEILNGRRSITGDTALRLAHYFGTSAEFWLNLQSLYELRIAEQKTGKSIRALPTLKRSEHASA
jgi:addiction module HigA family antidote